MCPSPQEVTRLMGALREGDNDSVKHLFELFYPELRRIAFFCMRGERVDHSLQPTALVNELYLELLKVKSLHSSENDATGKQAFLRLSAFIMRRLLIHHARPLSRRVEKVELVEMGQEFEDPHEALLDLERTLDRLAQINPMLRTVVTMRVFEGYSAEEVAERLECSRRTVNRAWNFARSWLGETLLPPEAPHTAGK